MALQTQFEELDSPENAEDESPYRYNTTLIYSQTYIPKRCTLIQVLPPNKVFGYLCNDSQVPKSIKYQFIQRITSSQAVVFMSALACSTHARPIYDDIKTTCSCYAFCLRISIRRSMCTSGVHIQV